MTTKERLIAYLAHKGLSQGKFEKICGLSNGYVNNIKRSVTPDKLQKITLCFEDLNTAWLITGEGEMLRRPEGSHKPVINCEGKGIPYYDIDFLSSFDRIQDRILRERPSYYVDFQPFNNADWWINVTGHSMEPQIFHGDIIAVKKIKNWKEFLLFGEIYAIETDEFRTVRIISESKEPDHLLLVPINPDGHYTPQVIPRKRIKQIFAVYGSLKKIDVGRLTPSGGPGPR